MPSIFVHCTPLTTEKKRELIKAITDDASRIMGAPAPAFSVTIYENSPDNIGVGGETLTARRAKAAAEKK